jgi:hypothetical protein
LLLLFDSSCSRQAGQQATSTGTPEDAQTRSDAAPLSSRAENTTMTSCEKAIQNIRDRDLAHWRGLPTSCDWTVLTGPLPADWQSVPGRPLGSAFRDAKMIMLSLEGYSRPSLSFVNDTAVLFEAMGPELATGDVALITALGEPAARLDWDFGTLPCPESEFVYPERGITLFLRSDRERVLHVALYRATDLDDYLENLRPRLGKTPRPMK